MTPKELLVNNPVAQIVIRVYRHFDTIPPAISLENYRFYIISNIAYTVAWMVHLVWLIVFFSIGQYTMASVQVASIGCHVAAIIFNRKGRHQIAMIIGMLEVVAHQLLAVAVLGWGAGFQYIIPAIVMFPFLKKDSSLAVKSLLVLCGLCTFLYLEIFFKDRPPVFILGEVVMKGFNYSNIFFCFALNAMWGWFITIAIHRSEEVINKKNQELFEAEKIAEQAELQLQLEVKHRDAEIYRLRNVELKNSNEEILLRNRIIEEEKKRSDDLLLNILPSEVAEELKDKGSAAAKYFEHVTVMFTDFVDFTTLSEQMSPQQLIDELDSCFKAFDGIIGKYNIEKIKTIGDAYLAVTGLPKADPQHAMEIVNAAIEINEFMIAREEKMGDKTFQLRIGIHSGSVVAGIVGVKKFAYDIWGDAVNVAARMEQHSEAGRINISGATYQLVKDYFDCEYRGKIMAKNKGEMDMYFVSGRK